MLFNQSAYDRYPIYFLPYSFVEQFVDITDSMVPGVRNYYMISNLGRVFHKYTNSFMKLHLDTKGYLYVLLSTDTPHRKTNCRVHRLVMTGFCNIENSFKFQVNHIDGIKTNNFIWNLEWVTPSQNAKHAIDNGLTNTNKGIYNDEIIHNICRLLEDESISLPDISRILNVPLSLVMAIQRKDTHTKISDNYNIQKRKLNSTFTVEQIKEICSWFCNNIRIEHESINNYCSRCLISLNYNNYTTSMIKTVEGIYTRNLYIHISKDYDF